jgi:hypothetical protein
MLPTGRGTWWAGQRPANRATRFAHDVPPPIPWQLACREGEAQFGGVSQLPAVLFARKHGLGLALKVHVRVTADVDGDSLDGAAGEVVR